jgi:hypothetical protein
MSEIRPKKHHSRTLCFLVPAYLFPAAASVTVDGLSRINLITRGEYDASLLHLASLPHFLTTHVRGARPRASFVLFSSAMWLWAATFFIP